MAEGSCELGGSVKESDFLHDFPCSPCEKDGKNVEATKYCADCDENMCAVCLTNHSRFAMTRGHTVLDQVQAIEGQTKQLLSKRCSKHGGKIIDVFCPKHDAVGCSTCISIDHSSCQGKQFIPDVAVGIKTSPELKQLEAELKTLKSKLDSLKKLKRDNLQRLKQDKDALIKRIKYIRKKMNDQLDKMEKELISEAEKQIKQKIETIHTSITEMDNILSKVQQAMDQMKSDNHDADIFVSCKVMKREMSHAIYPMHERIEELPPEHSLELHVDNNTNLIMEGKRMFASIKEKYTIHDVEYKNVQQEITRAQTYLTYPEGNKRSMVEKADLEYRSKMAGQAMRYNNPDIADLSNISRPTMIAERFFELYDNEWTDAFEALHKPKLIANEEEVIRLLLDIVERAYIFCVVEAERQIVDMRSSVLSVMSGGASTQTQVKTSGDGLLVQYPKTIASLAIDRLEQTFRVKEVPKIFATRRMDPPKAGKPFDLYTKKAVELTWWMCVQDPAIHMCLSSDKLDPSECPVLYRAYTRFGKNPDFFVWPALKLHKNGGVLMKGVMQFK